MDRSESAPGIPGGRGSTRTDVADAVRLGRQIQDTRTRWHRPAVRDVWSLRVGALVFVVSAAGLATVTDWTSFRST